MGAGASLQTAQASAKETMDKMNVPDSIPADIKAQIKNDLVNNAMFVAMVGEQAATFKGANPAEGAPVGQPVEVLYEGVDDVAKKLEIGAAVSKWHCHNIMMGACLLAKHHEKINAYFEACGPVPTAQGMQVTRKSMAAKLKAVGKLPDDEIEKSLDWFMTHVGNEHDKEQELGISRHENRMFWVNDFTCNGEEPTLKKLVSCMYWVTGEGEPYYGTPNAVVKE